MIMSCWLTDNFLTINEIVLYISRWVCTYQHNGNTTGKAVAPFSGELSWSIDNKQTTLREYWWISVSLGLKRSSVVPKPFESSLWSAPGEKFYPAPQFTAQDFASHHMQLPFHRHGKPTFRLVIWYKATNGQNESETSPKAFQMYQDGKKDHK